jgi:hypothetical protein
VAAVRWPFLAWIAAVAAAPAFTLVAIVTYGRNVPFWDEWVLVPMFQKAEEGTLDFDDFWGQHNEHRPLIPKAWDFGQAYVTDWNLQAELYRNFGIAVLTFLLLLVVMRRTLDRVAYVIASIVVSVIFFSPMQWENWMWGWQLEWFLSTLGAAGAFWAATFLIDRRPRAGFAVAVLGALVATFSLGQGMLVWPIVGLVLLLRGRGWRWLAAWAVVSIVTFVVYLRGYENPAYHPSKTLFLEKPVEFAEYICLYLGRAFGFETMTGVAAGAVLLLAFCAGLAYVVRHRRDEVLRDRAAFWLAAGVLSLGAAVITAVSRLGFGLEQAGSSRYSGMSALFGIATMMVIYAIVRAPKVAGREPTMFTRRRIMADVAVALLVVSLINTARGHDAMGRKSEQLDASVACTRLVTDPGDPCLQTAKTSPYPEQVQWIAWLRERGWAGY